MSNAKLLASVVAVLSVLTFSLPWFSESNEKSVYWLPQKQAPVRADIVILAIDNASLETLGRWPWSREVWGKISDQLAEAAPAGTAFDINFSEPSDQSQDLAFSSGIKKLGHVVLSTQGVVVKNSRADQFTNWVLPIPLLTMHDNISLGHPHVLENKSYLAPKSLAVENRSVEPLANALLSIPATNNQQFINFYGPAGSLTTIPVKDVLVNPELVAQLKDKWIFIGATASDLRDTVETPAGLMAGVEWHATVASNLLDQSTRQTVNPWLYTLLALGLPAVALFSRRQKNKLQAFFLVYAGEIVLVLLLAYVLWAQGVAFPPLVPAMTLVLTAASEGAVTWLIAERQKRQLERTVQSYFSPAVLSHLIKHPSHLELGGIKREVTILFSDIRGFTSISEVTEPQLLSQMLQEYFTGQTGEVLKTDGVVDKFIGDAIMAFWGAPLLQADHADRAIQSSLGMLKALPGLNQKFAEKGWPEIKIGIGLNSGQAVVGNLGSKQRFDYTVIGDAVNLASRLESSCKELGVPLIVSEFTKAQAKGHYDWQPLGSITVKGKSTPIDIFTIRL